MSRNIVIKNEYFTGIQTAINSLNQFFTSGFKVRNFPVLDEDYQLDPIVERIITRLETVDPTWLEDESRYSSVIQMINDSIQDINPVDGVYASVVDSNNDTLVGAIDSYIGFKMLQQIADNFQDFSKFINGIYTFNVFTKPSEYADVLNIFAVPLKFDEIPELDVEEKIFDEKIYIDGLMKSELVTLPADMNEEVEIERVYNRQDLQDVEVFVDDAVQEAAEVDYFEDTKPEHIKYDEKSKTWKVSKQFTTMVDNLVAELKKCETTDDLKAFFSKPTKQYAELMGKTVVPYILVKALTNAKKANGNFDNDTFTKYLDSYSSIVKQNRGSKRFENYDIFSTFKSDKEGTIKFIEDFLKLNLVNDPKTSIANNTLLTIFNIFDSRIYLDIAYNVSESGSDKTNLFAKNQFVMNVRSRINKNSRTKAAYKKDENESTEATPNDDTQATSETVSESVTQELRALGDMSISDMMYCEQYGSILERDIETLGDRIYNAGLSPFLIDAYIGESFNDINDQLGDFIQEANITKRRETLQSAVSSLMVEMEQIVDMNKKHRWNNNSFVHRYKTTAGMMLAPIPNVTGSSEGHTDIKQVYHWTKKAITGKSGNFTNDQLKTLTHLHDLVGDLWKCVKLFWVNPINWTKHMNVFNNTKIQGRVKEIAVIAERIVELKDDLEFLQDESFVTEAYYDGSPDYVFQEATTKTNNERLNTAVSLLMRDMKSIQERSKKKQWTNNACITTFKSETKGNLKQALKYVNSAIGGSCGKYHEDDISVLKTLREKLDEMNKLVRAVNVNPLVTKSVKESFDVRKIATLAGEIVDMESSLDFIKSLESSTGDTSSTSAKTDDGEATQESDVFDFDAFQMIMEQEKGEIPEYMKTRFKMTDDLKSTVTPTDLPAGVPTNPVPDIADSIDAKMDTDGENLGDMLGSGFENNPNKKDAEGKIVINVTNNYNNSFNKDSGNTNTSTVDDHSTGKTTTTTNTDSNNNSSHHNSSDSSHSKSVNTKGKAKGSNNNNNSTSPDDTKDSITQKDGKQKLSSGMSIQEMFMFLESEEPLSNGSRAGKPPKEDTLTKALDADRKTLAKQQKAKKGVQKAANTGKAILKPITRVKQWMTKMVDSLIKRDEETVKNEIMENASYRSSLFKASRIALKLGFTSFLFTLQPYLAGAYVAVQGLKLADKPRVKRELKHELETELKIVDAKIDELEHSNDPADYKQRFELMRIKGKMEESFMRVTNSKIKAPRESW